MGQKQVFKPYAIIESTMILLCRKISPLFEKNHKSLDTYFFRKNEETLKIDNRALLNELQYQNPRAKFRKKANFRLDYQIIVLFSFSILILSCEWYAGGN